MYGTFVELFLSQKKVMVNLCCDVCTYQCDHTHLGIKFAWEWFWSGKTKLAYCKDYSDSTCEGILRSGLSPNEIDALTQRTLEEYNLSP